MDDSIYMIQPIRFSNKIIWFNLQLALFIAYWHACEIIVVIKISSNVCVAYMSIWLFLKE